MKEIRERKVDKNVEKNKCKVQSSCSISIGFRKFTNNRILRENAAPKWALSTIYSQTEY